MSEMAFDPKWLPGSPHCEAILAFLADGRAHVVERGHGVAPLLVFEDGGAIELPRVRCAKTERGTELVAADEAEMPDQTKHRDVCGSLDELKARIAEAEGAHPERLLRLVRDARHMLGRLERRREAYEAFAAALRELADLTVDAPDAAAGLAACETLLERLDGADEQTLRDDREALFALAEEARSVANALEKCLARHKERATRMGALYEQIRGGRQWETPPTGPR